MIPFKLHRFLLAITLLQFLIFTNQKLYGQSPVFFHYNVEDGLPSSEVYDIHQDRKGFIWFATDHGLCRFDGSEFRTFTKEDGLSDNTIFDIREDHNDRLWLTTYSGGISYYENGKCGVHPANEAILEMLGRNYPDNLGFDTDGNMWISNSLSNLTDLRILKIDRANHLSIALNRKRYKPTSDESYNLENFIPIKNKIEQGEIVSEYNHEYLKLQDETFLLAATKRLYYIKNDHKELSFLTFKNRILTLFEDRQQNTWVSSIEGDGVYLFEDQDFSKGLHKNFLPGKTISDILQDQEGNYWFSTLEDGVFFLPSKDFISLSNQDNINTEKILAIEANDKDEVYFSTFSRELYKVNSKNQHIEKVALPKNSTAVFDILFHSNDKTYLSNGYVIDGENQFVLDKDRSKDSKVIIERSNQDVLFGRIRGVTVFNNDRPLEWSPTNEHNFKYVFSICEDSQQQLWIGSLSGLFKYSEDGLSDLKEKNPLFAQRITKIVEHSAGNLFMTTKGAGLLIKTTDSLYQITTDQGLSSNLLKTVFIENDTTLWVASNKGVNRLTFNLTNEFQLKKAERFRRFDGLPSEEINDITKSGGLIWLATNKGLTYFNPLKVITYDTPPNVHITRVLVNGKDTSFQQTLELNSKQNDISINFQAVSFRAAKQNRYRFKLKGYDEDWVETENKDVKYTNLPPGGYEFLLTACNSNNIWKETLQSFSFTINKHFTQELWFILLLILTALLSLFLIIQNLLKRQRDKESLARRIVESEQKALRAQINPHFIFNAMNSIQYFISDNDKKNAEIYLSRFSKLMRKVLEDSKKNMISLEEEIESLHNYLQLEKLRFPDRFEYEIIQDPLTDAFEVEVPPMIIQPFLENAIWHGLMPKQGKGLLRIQFEKQSDQSLLCTIRDNGIGRKESAKRKTDNSHQSTGIQNVRERIQVINSLFNTSMSFEIEDLLNSSGNNDGTLIRISFPALRA